MPTRKNNKHELNKKVPAFNCNCTPDQTIKLSDFKGLKLIIYFYPKDNTPGYTTERQDFQSAHAKFKRAGAMIFGVFRDSLNSY